MRSFKRPILITALALLGLQSCKNEASEEVSEDRAAEVIAEVRQEYVPDKRVALFDIESEPQGKSYVLKGDSNLPEAVAALREKLQAADVDYIDSIQLLPSDELKGKTRALVRTSVANIRSNQGHSSELATQATLGTPLKVLKHDGDWYLVQTPDNYIAWVDHGGITPLTEQEFASWKAAEKVIFLRPYGQAYEKAATNSGIVSDVVAGDIFVLKGSKNGFFEVEYPDGKIGYLEKDKAQPYKEWIASRSLSEEELVSTSKELMGLPYLWGGTSPKGVDCSGFTKTIYFMNGMVIPRDASQQVHTGKVVDSTKNFENLQPGDLLFFGTPATDSSKERVVHVGMWIGDNKMIHSSGNVHISSMDPNSEDFDEFNYNRYLRTKRLVGEEDPNLLLLSRNDLFMAQKPASDSLSKK
ncbi:C40 family peptidase [Salinimicrobium soli]|uniref:C40 family peptidase n=1 Tax=Salinimicrobium soli TaxID=1254399 RepID=UPI003AAE78FA